MGFYEWVDNYSMTVGSVIVKRKYFSESVESRSIVELLDLVKLDFPNFDGEGYYRVKVQYAGVTHEAAFRIEQWKGPQYPTIIYHHGAAEGSYDFSFNRILGKTKKSIPANLIAIQALFNHSNKEFLASIVDLSNYALMLASSTMIVEALVSRIRTKGDGRILITGISLGGFVTNLHFTYFNTADQYKPLLAGARIADVFIRSAYAKMTSAKGKSNPDKLRRVLDFSDAMRLCDQKKLFPLLGKFDRIIEYGAQSGDYKPEHIRLLPYGHATGATKFRLLREYMLDGLDNRHDKENSQ